MIGLAFVGIFGVLFIYAIVDAKYNQPPAALWLFRAWVDVVDRLPIFLSVTMLTFLQLLIGSRALSDSRAEEITSAFDFGVVTFGPYPIIAASLLIWLLLPLLRRTVKYLYLTNTRNREALADYWGEGA